MQIPSSSSRRLLGLVSLVVAAGCDPLPRVEGRDAAARSEGGADALVEVDAPVDPCELEGNCPNDDAETTPDAVVRDTGRADSATVDSTPPPIDVEEPDAVAPRDVVTPMDVTVRDATPDVPRDTAVPDTSAPDAAPTPRPDLVVTAARWTFTPPMGANPNFYGCNNSTTSGTRVDMGQSITLTNRGTARSAETTFAFGFVNADNRFLYGMPTQRVPALDPDDSFSFTGSVCASASFRTMATPAGVYRAATMIDPTALVAESDETNNVLVGTFSFTWDPDATTTPGDCRPCATTAECPSGTMCAYRRCDGRGGCYATGGSATCSTIGGAACASSSLFEACTGASSCPSTAGCISFAGGITSHCAFRCTSTSQCTHATSAAFDGRAQLCTPGNYCVMTCSGPGASCPGVTRCQSSFGGYHCI